MTLLRWYPLEGKVTKSHRLNRTADDSYSPSAERSFGTWAPAIEILETKDRLAIRAEVPGVERDDAYARIEDDVRTRQNEHEQGTDFEDESAQQLGDVYGAFTWSLTLPPRRDAAKVAATDEDGIVEGTVPRARTVRPKSTGSKPA